MVLIADEGDGSTESFEAWLEEFCHFQSHIALADGSAGADAEPSFFHFRPLAADVAWINRDVKSGQRTMARRGWKICGRFPMAGRRCGGSSGGEAKSEDITGR